MKKLFGLCAALALVTGGVVLSDDVKSIVEQSIIPDAEQTVESAISDSGAQLIQDEALPEEAAPAQQAMPEHFDAPALKSSKAVAEKAVEEAVADDAAVEEVIQEPVQEFQPAPNTPYILGVIVSPVPQMVRAQVALPEGAGLFVQRIKTNGPADKAGVLPYDIIVSIDGITVNSTNDLVAQIQKAAGKPQKLTIMRHGTEVTVDVIAQPADAPRLPHSLLFSNPVIPAPQQFIDPSTPDDEMDEDDFDPSFPRFQRFMDLQRQQMDSMRQRMEAMENAMRQSMPGFIPFRGPVPTPAPMPNGALTLPPAQFNDPNAQVQNDSFSVQVYKNGNAPAIIKIRDNNNEYEVDENSIDQLPENVRNRLNFRISN